MGTASTLHRAVGGIAILCGFAAGAAGQTFNVDVGGDSPPSDACCAASGRGGEWTVVPADQPVTPWPLVDVDGRATRVSVLYTQGAEVDHDAAETVGDDGALLDDHSRFQIACSWAISGLEPGMYDVYTYSWASDHPLDETTRIEVVGSVEGEQEIGGSPWRGTFVQGEHYARHRVTVAAGSALQIELEAGANGFGVVNAIQILRQPLATGDARDPAPERHARDEDGTGSTSGRAVRGRPSGGTAAGLAPRARTAAELSALPANRRGTLRPRNGRASSS